LAPQSPRWWRTPTTTAPTQSQNKPKNSSNSGSPASKRRRLRKPSACSSGSNRGSATSEEALKTKALAEKTGRKAYLLAGHEITPDALLEFPQFDAYVNTACPRISLDAPGKFKKPILTVNEFMVVCGEVTWTDVLRKGLFAN
jgi:hypothetical protein